MDAKRQYTEAELELILGWVDARGVEQVGAARTQIGSTIIKAWHDDLTAQIARRVWAQRVGLG